MKKLLKNKVFIALYALWGFIHTALLLMGDSDGTNHFWPFTEQSFKETYDVSEWFVYVTAPLVFILLIKAIADKRSSTN